jgi:hypothetical protein
MSATSKAPPAIPCNAFPRLSLQNINETNRSCFNATVPDLLLTAAPCLPYWALHHTEAPRTIATSHSEPAVHCQTPIKRAQILHAQPCLPYFSGRRNNPPKPNSQRLPYHSGIYWDGPQRDAPSDACLTLPNSLDPNRTLRDAPGRTRLSLP